MKKIKDEFPIGGMIIITILGLIGLAGIVVTILVSIKDGFLEGFSKSGAFFLFGLFFFSISVYVWIYFFKNVLIKPKEETLFLLEKDIFIDKKGKQYNYNSKKLKAHRYYQVIKTSDYIHEIKEESQNEFPLKIKDNFWLNWYSPHGDFENVVLLPILYLIFSLFFFSSLLSKIPINIIIGAIGIYPLYYIIYDIKKKIEKNKSNQEYLKTITKSD